ncbi:MAG: ATP synthase F1 subunit epsilon [Petrimonas sp.]|nr:ATP synthase F1 subunit epsilon [Petrimonas sp.]
MKLEILTPEKILFSGEVESVTLPGTLGSFQVLEDHAPIISSLTEGRLEFLAEGHIHELDVMDGFMEMNNNVVTVCVDAIKNNDEKVH